MPQAYPATSATRTNSPIRILLVDDNLGFLKTAAGFLAAEPLLEIVGQAVTGLDALEQVASLGPDLVLMDVAMPQMNGLEATRRIKMEPGAPLIIILTMYDNPEYRAEARSAGADGFMAKWDLGLPLLSLIYGMFGAETRGQAGRCTGALEPIATDGTVPPDDRGQKTRCR